METKINGINAKTMVDFYQRSIKLNKDYIEKDKDKALFRGYIVDWKKMSDDIKYLIGAHCSLKNDTPSRVILFTKETSSNLIINNEIGLMRKMDILYWLKDNRYNDSDSPYFGFYLLLKLTAADNQKDFFYYFVIAKSEKGCSDILPLTVDCDKLTITTGETDATLVTFFPSGFKNIFAMCDEAISIIEDKIGDKLIKNY